MPLPIGLLGLRARVYPSAALGTKSPRQRVSLGLSGRPLDWPTVSDTPENTKRLLLIDGHSMAFRAFYALPAENFSTSGGQHTNAVYGFLSMFANILADEKPTHALSLIHI